MNVPVTVLSSRSLFSVPSCVSVSHHCIAAGVAFASGSGQPWPASRSHCWGVLAMGQLEEEGDTLSVWGPTCLLTSVGPPQSGEGPSSTPRFASEQCEQSLPCPTAQSPRGSRFWMCADRPLPSEATSKGGGVGCRGSQDWPSGTSAPTSPWRGLQEAERALSEKGCPERLPASRSHCRVRQAHGHFSRKRTWCSSFGAMKRAALTIRAGRGWASGLRALQPGPPETDLPPREMHQGWGLPARHPTLTSGPPQNWGVGGYWGAIF